MNNKDGKRRKGIRQITAIGVMFLFVLGGVPSPAWANSPHYLKATASFNPNTAEYSVTIKEAGLGTASSVTYTLNVSANFTVVCVNKGGNQVQGEPKSGSGSATTQTTLPVHNGQTSGTITVGPAAFTLPDPGCTGTQRLEITAAQYFDVSLDDGLGTTSPSLPNLGGSGLSVII